MDIVLGRMRHVEIDHLRQPLDVEAARGDVGGDQHRGLAGLEIFQRDQALGLRLVAVDGVGVDVVAPQLVREAVRADARAAEDQHLVELARLDEVGEELALLLARHGMQHMADELGGGVARRDLDLDRVAQQRLGEGADLVGEGRGKKQVLPVRGQERDDPLDVGQEAHVEHAIGFVQHQHRYLVEHHRLVLHMVEQAAGRRHQDLHAAPQLGDLRVHVHAAVDHGAAKRHMFSVVAEAFRHLDRELARRREHERPHRVARGRRRGAGVGRQPLQDRQREGGGLAGAGLRARHEVAPREHHRDRLLLDRRGLFVAELGDRARERRDQAELIEHLETRVN